MNFALKNSIEAVNCIHDIPCNLLVNGYKYVF